MTQISPEEQREDKGYPLEGIYSGCSRDDRARESYIPGQLQPAWQSLP